MIIDLKEKSGLGLRFDINNQKMFFDKDLQSSLPAIRTINQMQEVLLDKDVRQPRELYYMYRDIYRLPDKEILEKYKLRYDVTVIKPSCLGREYMKTAGHYHVKDFGELYEIVSGRCFCLLQRSNLGNDLVIKEVILVEAVAGQKIVIPPGFGHILINLGPDYLITSNWVSNVFESRYELYRKAEGAAYFVTKGDGEFKTTPYLKVRAGFIRNKNFDEVANINFVQPAREIKKFGLIENKPMYNLINENPAALNFLNHPLDYEYGDVFIFTKS